MKENVITSEFLRQVIDINPSFVFVKDREGRFTLVNKAVAEAYGTTVEHLIGKTDADFNPNLEEVEHFRRDDLEVMDSLQEKFIPEEVITDAEGRTRYLQTIKRPLMDKDGVARHVLGVATDITQLKLAEKERSDLQAQVLHAQKLESLGVLAGGIAHDFNNLLMGVQGYADLAEILLSRDDRAREPLRQIKLASHRAAELCRQMLDYTGKGRYVVECVDLSVVVREIMDLLEISTRKNAELHLDLSTTIPRIQADPAQLRQIVMNLITNASDAIQNRDGVISVITGATDCRREEFRRGWVSEDMVDGRFVYLEVTDNGVGMEEHTLTRIFDPFFSTKLSGRGLGLATVLGITRGHKGAIQVTSRPGEGTTFKVFFPVGDLEAQAEHPAGTEVDHGSAFGVVLVVDDEEMVRGVTKSVLEHSGFSVLTARDGVEGIEMFRRKSNEVLAVVLDMTMPRMNGEQTFREIQSIRPQTPIILMSGNTEPESIETFRGGGMVRFLKKPFQVHELVESLKQMQEEKTGSA